MSFRDCTDVSKDKNSFYSHLYISKKVQTGPLIKHCKFTQASCFCSKCVFYLLLYRFKKTKALSEMAGFMTDCEKALLYPSKWFLSIVGSANLGDIEKNNRKIILIIMYNKGSIGPRVPFFTNSERNGFYYPRKRFFNRFLLIVGANSISVCDK